MHFGMKLLLGGIFCAAIGIWWTISGIFGAFPSELGGLLWKGPLLLLGGVASAVMGVRMMRDKGPQR